MVLLVCIGVQGRLGARMVWVCGNISIVGGVNLCLTSDMMLVVVLKFNFGMICGGKLILRIDFLVCTS